MQKRDYILLSDSLRGALADCAGAGPCRAGVAKAARFIAHAIGVRKAEFDKARFFSDIGL